MGSTDSESVLESTKTSPRDADPNLRSFYSTTSPGTADFSPPLFWGANIVQEPLISGWKLVFVESLQGDPAKGGKRTCRGARTPAAKKVEFHRRVVITEPLDEIEFLDRDHHTRLFQTFSAGSRFRLFLSLQLPTGELPEPGQGDSGRPFADQELILMPNDSDRDALSFARGLRGRGHG